MTSMMLGMFSFPTAMAQDQRWGTPEMIDMGPGEEAWYPKVAVDPNGNAIAVWEHQDGSVWNIRSNRYVAGVGWMMPELIETNDTGNAGEVEVAVDAAGNAIAVWEQFDGAVDNIWANRYEVGVGWGTAEMIETNDTGSANYADVAVDAAGNAIVVWEQYDVLWENIWANRYEVGVGWGTAELIETGPDNAYDVRWRDLQRIREQIRCRHRMGNARDHR
jgi:hypothetical protein